VTAHTSICTNAIFEYSLEKGDGERQEHCLLTEPKGELTSAYCRGRHDITVTEKQTNQNFINIEGRDSVYISERSTKD